MYNSSSEEDLKNSRTSRGSYLYLKSPNYVKIFQIYLVTQSLKTSFKKFSPDI
jgi:hypothetical protein